MVTDCHPSTHTHLLDDAVPRLLVQLGLAEVDGDLGPHGDLEEDNEEGVEEHEGLVTRLQD